MISLSEAQRRIAPAKKANVQILARGREAFIGLLSMDGGGKVPEHRDATEEFIHVLSGQGTIYIDGAAHTISAGSTVYMPAKAKVSMPSWSDTQFRPSIRATRSARLTDR